MEEEEILTSSNIMNMLSNALNLLESDLYQKDNFPQDNAMLGTGMANLAQVLLEYRRTEEGAAEIARLRAFAENSVNAPDYNGVEDMPPDDYDFAGASDREKPVYDGASGNDFGGAES